MSENIIDKIKFYQQKIQEIGIAIVDIEEEKRKDGLRCFIEIGDQTVFDSNGFNVSFLITLTIRDVKKNWQEVVKKTTLLQKKLKDEIGHQDSINAINKITDDSDTVLRLTVNTDYRKI